MWHMFKHGNENEINVIHALQFISRNTKVFFTETIYLSSSENINSSWELNRLSKTTGESENGNYDYEIAMDKEREKSSKSMCQWCGKGYGIQNKTNCASAIRESMHTNAVSLELIHSFIQSFV